MFVVSPKTTQCARCSCYAAGYVTLWHSWGVRTDSLWESDWV